MSVVVLGIYAGSVVYEDDSWDLHRLPLSVLSGIEAAIASGDVVELDSCHVCVDGPAALDTTDLNDRPVCLTHAPDDDKDA